MTYEPFTDTVQRLIAGSIYMTLNSYGAIGSLCDELLRDLENSGHYEYIEPVKRIIENLNHERGQDFTDRQWIAELRKLEKTL